MDFLNSIFHFFTDKSKQLSHKAVLFLVIIAGVILVDSILGFSHFYNKNNTIKYVENVNKVLADTTLSKKERKQLKQLREETINRKKWVDRTWDVFSDIEFIGKKNNTEQEIINKDSVSENKINERSYLLHFVSSSWLILLIMILTPYVAFFDSDNSFWQGLGGLLIIEPILYFIALLFSKLFSFIPVILNQPIYNYILNAILLVLISWLVSRINKK